MLTPVDIMQGEDEKDTQLLREMSIRARDYVTSFHWCPPITGMYLGDGVGYIVAIFLFEFDRKIDGTDDKLWVVVGDLPSAYMVVGPNDFPQEALERYCLLMEDWIAVVRGNGDFDRVYPVDAPRTKKNADLLESRLAFLRREIIPRMSTQLVHGPDYVPEDGS